MHQPCTQDMMFAILKNLAENDVAIKGNGVLEVLADGSVLERLNQITYQRLVIFMSLITGEVSDYAQATQLMARSNTERW